MVKFAASLALSIPALLTGCSAVPVGCSLDHEEGWSRAALSQTEIASIITQSGLEGRDVAAYQSQEWNVRWYEGPGDDYAACLADGMKRHCSETILYFQLQDGEYVEHPLRSILLCRQDILATADNDYLPGYKRSNKR